VGSRQMLSFNVAYEDRGSRGSEGCVGFSIITGIAKSALRTRVGTAVRLWTVLVKHSLGSDSDRRWRAPVGSRLAIERFYVSSGGRYTETASVFDIRIQSAHLHC